MRGHIWSLRLATGSKFCSATSGWKKNLFVVNSWVNWETDQEITKKYLRPYVSSGSNFTAEVNSVYSKP